MPLRLYHLPGMHVGKFLGNVVQRYNLAVPGLRGAQWFRKSIEPEQTGGWFLLWNRIGCMGDGIIYLTEIE
jgi:hypothetical protein